MFPLEMSRWDSLPSELKEMIMHWRRALTCYKPGAVRIQSAWRGYRLRVLLGRFRLLQYLRDFRRWNPTVSMFLYRAKL